MVWCGVQEVLLAVPVEVKVLFYSHWPWNIPDLWNTCLAQVACLSSFKLLQNNFSFFTKRKVTIKQKWFFMWLGAQWRSKFTLKRKHFLIIRQEMFCCVSSEGCIAELLLLREGRRQHARKTRPFNCTACFFMCVIFYRYKQYVCSVTSKYFKISSNIWMMCSQ